MAKLNKNKKTLIRSGILFLIMVFLPITALALPINTSFLFKDFKTVNKVISTNTGRPTSLSYTHTLESTDFNPVISPTDKIDIQSNALTLVQMSVVPDPGYNMTIVAKLDDIFIGSETFSSKALTHIWAINMTDPDAINAMENLVGNVWFGITSGSGRVTLYSSIMSGTGIANPVPEPSSILLLIGCVGSGFVYLRKKPSCC
ncbi:MAG: PEP-CTERM sorting domain-containing protein [Candidatus Schekmanbacteria bacterium]|nr:PEP-CTERM sorting domain-containing protein [Candidatus Schekmanbacteria bacterium]